MAFDQQKRGLNELLKFVADSEGNPAVRVKVESIELSEGSSLIVKDHRGFVLWEIDEATGDIRHKGAFIKI